MFKTTKLKNEINQLKQENADLRHELDDQKELTRHREEFGINEFNENCKRRKELDKVEKILYSNNYNNTELQLRLIKEVIRPQNKITSKY